MVWFEWMDLMCQNVDLTFSEDLRKQTAYRPILLGSRNARKKVSSLCPKSRCLGRKKVIAYVVLACVIC